jgi:hypothetical protein
VPVGGLYPKAVAFAPSAPGVVYVGGGDYIGGAPIRKSSDGGATWGADQYLCPCAGTSDQDDPQLTVTNTGVVYAVWMESFVPGVSFAKSSDHGQTWTAPIHVDGGVSGGSDKPWLINSPDGQDVYIGISTGDFLVTSSHNFGASFGPLVKANTDTDYWYPEGGAVAPNGDAYFAASADGSVDSQLSIVRSTNGGTSWTTQKLGNSKGGRGCGGGCPSYFYNGQSSMAIDSAGTMMFAYVANTAAKGNKSLYVRTSTDGVTWTPAQVISSAGDANFPPVWYAWQFLSVIHGEKTGWEQPITAAS